MKSSKRRTLQEAARHRNWTILRLRGIYATLRAIEADSPLSRSQLKYAKEAIEDLLSDAVDLWRPEK